MPISVTKASLPTSDMNGGRDSEPAQYRYNAVARRLHWTVAALIAAMFATDWMREAFERGSPWKSWLLATHESIGLLVLVLSVFRLGWRLIHPAAPLQGTVLMQKAAALGHTFLYAATLALPLAGIARAMLKGDSIVFFGLVIPSLTGRNDALRPIASFAHGGLIMNLLLALIAGHVIAGFWHQFVLKDDTLRRMG